MALDIGLEKRNEALLPGHRLLESSAAAVVWRVGAAVAGPVAIRRRHARRSAQGLRRAHPEIAKAGGPVLFLFACCPPLAASCPPPHTAHCYSLLPNHRFRCCHYFPHRNDSSEKTVPEHAERSW